jgi:hypothetical protein
MATGEAWNLDNPTKPWALFDTNARIIIPFEIQDWLIELGTTYADHEILTDIPLECDGSMHSNGVIAITMQLHPSAILDVDYVINTKYPFTVRLTGADGQIDDRTLWLKLVHR